MYAETIRSKLLYIQNRSREINLKMQFTIIYFSKNEDPEVVLKKVCR